MKVNNPNQQKDFKILEEEGLNTKVEDIISLSRKLINFGIKYNCNVTPHFIKNENGVVEYKLIYV